MSYTIREMNKEDIIQVQAVAKKAWNTTYEGIIPLKIQESFLKKAYSEERLNLRLERSLFLVAESDGRVVAFANFSPVKDDGQVELAAIYLLPEYQGKGLGSALLQEGINRLAGVKKMYLNVERENQIGMTFYKAKGFVVVDEYEEVFEGHILHTVTMALEMPCKKKSEQPF